VSVLEALGVAAVVPLGLGAAVVALASGAVDGVLSADALDEGVAEAMVSLGSEGSDRCATEVGALAGDGSIAQPASAAAQAPSVNARPRTPVRAPAESMVRLTCGAGGWC